MTHWVRYFNLTSNLVTKSVIIAEELEMVYVVGEVDSNVLFDS